ncbi:ribokinase [Evansella caseinilytica]|uniref:Ribokinase n=1 Tax=Evansella caseinilytica TaxID=1503961 RepID=A0A1H3UGP1_9BACI|nr:ribokinase [Evansella caseinilytica]SDZ61466.1 ribokinase [Evansella caseinilytica]
MSKRPVITVIGSINMDMVTVTDSVPVQGETIIGERFATVPGGKGANQAVAAARLGGKVQFIGRVGEDAIGKQLMNTLQQEGISINGVEPVTHTGSGTATIIVSNGDNRIIVVPGANKEVTPDYVRKYHDSILSSDLVLLQFEIPLETVKYCLNLCSEHGISVILNPAPARALDAYDWKKAAYITPNETEAKELFSEQQARDRELDEKLIITMGEGGVKFINEGAVHHAPAYNVKAVDTTGAGDTFNGALAVALAENKPLPEAVAFANGAAALSVQRFGAQGGMPTREELNDFFTERGKEI